MQPNRFLTDTQLWLARAEQARRVARMLSAKDAAVVEAYAKECEARAERRDEPPLAA